MSIDVNGIKLLQKRTGHISDVTCCDFTFDYTLITGSSDKTVRIWDWKPGAGYTERSTSPLTPHKYQVTAVRVSPHSSLLATASVDGTAILWNLQATKRLYTFNQVNSDAIRSCRFSPDSTLLVTGGDNGAICIWDLVHRSLVRSIMTAHEDACQTLAFTPDAKLLITACSLEVIKIWTVETLIDTTTVQGSILPAAKVENAIDMGILSADVSPLVTSDEDDPLNKSYTLATGGNMELIKLWTIRTKIGLKYEAKPMEVSIQYHKSFDGHTSSITCVKYNQTGDYLLSSSLDKTIKLWNQFGQCLATLKGHERYVNCVCATRDFSLIASGSTGSNDKSILIWDVKGSLQLDSVLNSLLPITIPETHLLQDGDDSEVVLLEKVENIADYGINSVAFNHNLILAIGSGDKLVRMFRIELNEDKILFELPQSPLEGHTYAVNCVEFSPDGTTIASCSLDGCTNFYSVETGEIMYSFDPNCLGVKVCRFSSDGKRFITAGDDQKAIIWDLETKEVKQLLEGHLDSVTGAGFSPDGKLVVTGSSNGDFRVWEVETGKMAVIEENSHCHGVQGCDFSHNFELERTNPTNEGYLLATCGNDSLVKLWQIIIFNLHVIEVKEWRVLAGHGGHVISVKFNPNITEVLCSTASDRQARIWSVLSGECLHVLDHDSIVTCCAFSHNCAFLATGTVDKTLTLWRMPQQMVFETMVANKLRIRTKSLIDWTNSDVLKWMVDMRLDDLTQNAQNSRLNGEKLLVRPIEALCSGLELNDEQTERFTKEVRWLRTLQDRQPILLDVVDVPHEFLCPITHEVMREPVVCSDGFTYEKQAICEWFMAGKYTSPMTNEQLSSTEYKFNQELREAIYSFLDAL